jgi:GntR family transcriptional repressor for pyruvate dehydrogenase complex
MMHPVKKTRIYEDIIRQFMRKIENGELSAGDRIPTERELVEQLGVSRASIREALRAMELIGLVESKVGGGTYIKSLTVDRAFTNLARVLTADNQYLLDMYEVRILLETYSVRQAARKRTEGHLAMLKSSLDVLKKDMAQERGRVEADTLFHKTLAEAAGNAALISVLSLCSELINSSIIVADAYVNALDIIYEHEAIYDAVEKKDEKTAARLMRAHIKRAYNRTKFILRYAEQKNE